MKPEETGFELFIRLYGRRDSSGAILDRREWTSPPPPRDMARFSIAGARISSTVNVRWQWLHGVDVVVDAAASVAAPAAAAAAAPAADAAAAAAPAAAAAAAVGERFPPDLLQTSDFSCVIYLSVLLFNSSHNRRHPRIFVGCFRLVVPGSRF